MTIFPVYKDTYCTVVSTSSTDFHTSIDYELRVMESGDVIFSGRAYKLPDSNNVSFNVSKIVQSFIKSNIDPLKENQLQRDNDATLHFGVYINGVLKEEFFTYDDYSYKESGSLLNSPIRGIYDEDGKCIISVLNASSTAKGMQINGTSVSVPSLGIYHYVLDCGGITSGKVTVIYDGKITEWKVRNMCTSYGLMYKNTRGGYDYFPIEGRTVKTDKWDSYIINRSFNNNTLDFEIDNYLLDENTLWELHTGYLKEDEVYRMGEIFKSTKVFLYVASEDRYIPVVITDKEVKYLHYGNNGQNMAAYTINIKESQSKVIR